MDLGSVIVVFLLAVVEIVVFVSAEIVIAQIFLDLQYCYAQ